MNSTETGPRPEYRAARDAFDRLNTQDKAAFVLEATLGTLGNAIRDTGRQVADAIESLDLDAVFRDAKKKAAEAADDVADAVKDAADSFAGSEPNPAADPFATPGAPPRPARPKRSNAPSASDPLHGDLHAGPGAGPSDEPTPHDDVPAI